MPISTDDRIDLIFKTQFGKLYTSSELTLGQELDIGYFSFERDQIFGQEIPDVFILISFGVIEKILSKLLNMVQKKEFSLVKII